ncbi:MAG: pyrroline-5-carboxylate reductase [Pseudomonadota bacterium]
MSADFELVLVGGGRMGGALVRGWLAHGWSPSAIRIIEPDASRADELRTELGVAVVASPGSLSGVAAYLVIAVKPQMMAEVLPTLAPILASDSLFISIAAGTKIAMFEQMFGGSTPVVRAMPNTPAAIGAGISVLCANRNVQPAQREMATTLLAAVGDVEWVDDEHHMHAVTGLSGSGPAYVFALVEALAKAGAEAGLPGDLAMKMARQTVIGSGQLMAADPSAAPTLRRNVTSPGGTTAAALERLLAKDGIDRLMSETLAAAIARSKALA